jgi:hypothetical protein
MTFANTRRSSVLPALARKDTDWQILNALIAARQLEQQPQQDQHAAHGAPANDEQPADPPSSKRPPNDRGQGRKPMSANGERMKPRQIRMTDADWEKCLALGGSAWVRERIKLART